MILVDLTHSRMRYMKDILLAVFNTEIMISIFYYAIVVCTYGILDIGNNFPILICIIVSIRYTNNEHYS